MDNKNDTEMVAPELQDKVVEASKAEDDMYATIAPKGKFSKMAMNGLVRALNKLLPWFGIKEEYPTFSEDMITEFPVAFVKQIGMVQKAVEDATEEGSVPMELSFSLDDITEDRSITMLTGKIDRLSKMREFKTFLASPRSDEAKAESDKPEDKNEMPEDSDASIDSLFLNRM